MKPDPILFALLIVLAGSFSAAQDTGRQVIEINENWKMHRFGNNLWYDATVPGCVHTDLISNKLIPDPFYRENEKNLQWIDKYSWEYATVFQVGPEMMERGHLELHLEGLDTYADVYVNDQLVLTTDNMFIDWRVDVKEQVRKGENALRILFHSPIAMGMLNRDRWDIEAPMGFNLDFGPGLGGLSGASDFPSVGPYTRKGAYMYGWDWAPRLTTSGIWRPVYLEAWDDARIASLQVVQEEVTPSLARVQVMVEVESGKKQEATVAMNYGTGGGAETLEPVVVNLEQGLNTVPLEVVIEDPERWWPNGMGEHPLYDFRVTLSTNKGIQDSQSARTGLRTVRLVTEPDRYGTSFYFEVNGEPVFAKGANYVPTDIFPSRSTPEHYRTLIASAADAHMNMLRVWGGGIYESDLFYDLCDEYGIMIWQDFAFAISMVPDYDDFLESIREEVTDNIIRLRNHPSIVLWCGNNETKMIWEGLVKRFFGMETAEFDIPALTSLLGMIPVTPVRQETTDKVLGSYDRIFYHLIPEELEKYDLNRRSYRSSSPIGENRGMANPYSGDMHYYIAYMNAPFEAYYTSGARFYSEHGFQSFPDFNTVKRFTKSEDWDILSPVMQHHQRAMGGNQVLDKYMRMYYHYPKDFESYLYVSQVMQADVMQIAFETHRKSRPYTMGTLYWQLNDVWPVASWSSMDYMNHWKALHYQAKRSFSNVIVVPVYYRDTFRIHVVSDSLASFAGEAEVRVLDFNGKELKTLNLPVEVQANGSQLLVDSPGEEFLQGIDTTICLCKVRLLHGDRKLASNICYFAAAKNLKLPAAEIRRKIRREGEVYRIELSSKQFARKVFLSAEGEGFFSDNYFDLLPGEKKVVTFTPGGEIGELEAVLKIVSLVDSYSDN